jgi:hypothetical protein
MSNGDLSPIKMKMDGHLQNWTDGSSAPCNLDDVAAFEATLGRFEPDGNWTWRVSGAMAVLQEAWIMGLGFPSAQFSSSSYWRYSNSPPTPYAPAGLVGSGHSRGDLVSWLP